MIKFEDKIDVINQIIYKKQGQWNLYAISYMDYSDVAQIIRAHIYEKWDKWDQSRPLEKWLTTVVSHQIINIKRNNLGKFISPCSNCPFDKGEDECGFSKSGKKTTECPEYKKWIKKKKSGHALKLASSIYHDDGSEVQNLEANSATYDLDNKVDKFHEVMLKTLPDKLKFVYTALYIDHKPDSYVAEQLKLKCSEPNRAPGYKQIANYKTEIIRIAKSVLKTEDIFYDQ